ncbi:MAG: hypothetical protein IKH14_03550 [Prevotella sp.]|nr:hypothetical protein [Prevotella sp.]
MPKDLYVTLTFRHRWATGGQGVMNRRDVTMTPGATCRGTMNGSHQPHSCRCRRTPSRGLLSHRTKPPAAA